MTDRDTYGLYQWQGQFGDIEADEQDRPRRKRPGPEFPFTPVRRCVRCDGFMIAWARYTHVTKQKATECHHCLGEIRCETGKHHIEPGRGCVVCEVFRDR